jgi:hypothetical protein
MDKQSVSVSTPSTSSASSTTSNPPAPSVSEVSVPSGSSSNKEAVSKEDIKEDTKETKKLNPEEYSQRLIAIAESVPLKGSPARTDWARSIVIRHKELVSKYIKEKKELPVKASWWVENEKDIPAALQAYTDFLEEGED